MATAGRGASRGPPPPNLIKVDLNYIFIFCNLRRGGSDYKDEVPGYPRPICHPGDSDWEIN
jgi:hypothetical protein